MADEMHNAGAPSRRLRTMEEFAAAAGVSRPTVSKFFHDPDSVRPASRDRIRSAMRELDYQPNLLAVNFNRRTTRTVGVVVPSVADPFYAEVVRRVELAALEAGHWSIVISSHADPALEARALHVLDSMKVAGILVAPLGEGPPSRPAGSPPVVFVDSRPGGGGFVGTDNARSFEVMVEYLCRSGEPPCLVAMPGVNRNARERLDAYREAMRRLGHAPLVVEAGRSDWAFEEVGLEVAERALDSGGFPSRTVLCANDRLAFGVMSAASRRGLRIGRSPACDLRVAGHDDHPLSRFSCPSLTTMAQDCEGIAKAALSALTARIGSDAGAAADGAVVLLEAKLVMRDSA